jgi:hypothetical protein
LTLEQEEQSDCTAEEKQHQKYPPAASFGRLSTVGRGRRRLFLIGRRLGLIGFSLFHNRLVHD